MKYILDTNVISEPLRPTPVVSVVQRIREHQEDIAIPAMVWFELRFGCERLPPSHRRTNVENYITNVVLNAFPILHYDLNAANWHAIEHARLVAVGKTPPFVDGQIAAIAFVNGLRLVTANTSDFEEFDGLQLENWH